MCTVLVGLGMLAVGKLRLARLVKACPFVIYGGFMAGTGAARQLRERTLERAFRALRALREREEVGSGHGEVLIQYALNLMSPGFVSCALNLGVGFQSWLLLHSDRL